MCTKSGGTQTEEIATTVFASGLLAFMAIDRFGPSPRTSDGSQYVVILTDRSLTLTQAIPTDKTSFAHVTNVFFDSWIVSYGRHAYVLTDNGVHFTSMLFAALCIMLDVEHSTTALYYHQTNEQIERYNLTLVFQLRQYVAKNQQDWDKYVHRLACAYNMQVHKSMNITHLVLYFHCLHLDPQL